jgi:transketolase
MAMRLDEAVVITDTELMGGYRRLGSRLQGHPSPVLPWGDVASGSLGEGIGNGVGVALAGKFLDESPFHVWVLCGDAESANLITVTTGASINLATKGSRPHRCGESAIKPNRLEMS